MKKSMYNGCSWYLLKSFQCHFAVVLIALLLIHSNRDANFPPFFGAHLTRNPEQEYFT